MTRAPDPSRTAALSVWVLALMAIGCDDPTPVGPTPPIDPFPVVPYAPNTTFYSHEKTDAGPGATAPRAGTRGLRAEFDVWTSADASAAVRAQHSWTFPERFRVEWRRDGGSVATRAYVHRFGEEVWRRDALDSQSTALAPDAARSVAIEDGLRLAALLWPDGFEWRIDGQTARAALDDRIAPLVEIVADLSESGQPMRLRADALQLDVSDWRAMDGRSVPWVFDFKSGTQSWSEELVRLQRCAAFADVLFLPVEVGRERSGRAPRLPAVITIDDLPRFPQRRVLLPESERNLVAALEAARSRVAEAAARGDTTEFLVEVDDTGRPSALIERVRVAADADGFQIPPPRQARSLVLTAVDNDTIRTGLAQLLGTAQVEVRVGAAYLWMSGATVHLVVPLER